MLVMCVCFFVGDFGTVSSSFGYGLGGSEGGFPHAQAQHFNALAAMHWLTGVCGGYRRNRTAMWPSRHYKGSGRPLFGCVLVCDFLRTLSRVSQGRWWLHYTCFASTL